MLSESSASRVGWNCVGMSPGLLPSPCPPMVSYGCIASSREIEVIRDYEIPVWEGLV